jgi:hypothetical protein
MDAKQGGWAAVGCGGLRWAAVGCGGLREKLTERHVLWIQAALRNGFGWRRQGQHIDTERPPIFATDTVGTRLGEQRVLLCGISGPHQT